MGAWRHYEMFLQVDVDFRNRVPASACICDNLIRGQVVTEHCRLLRVSAIVLCPDLCRGWEARSCAAVQGNSDLGVGPGSLRNSVPLWLLLSGPSPRTTELREKLAEDPANVMGEKLAPFNAPSNLPALAECGPSSNCQRGCTEANGRFVPVVVFCLLSCCSL